MLVVNEEIELVVRDVLYMWFFSNTRVDRYFTSPSSQPEFSFYTKHRFCCTFLGKGSINLIKWIKIDVTKSCIGVPKSLLSVHAGYRLLLE